MAKGKHKSYKKGRGPISRFVDCLLTCCRPRRARDNSYKTNKGDNQLVPMPRRQGPDGEGFPANAYQWRDSWWESTDCRTRDNSCLEVWENLCQELKVDGAGRSRDDDNVDGVIDARGDAVPRWLRVYRQFILRSIDERVQDFCRIVSDFFQKLGVPAHEVRTSIKTQNGHAVLHVMGAKRAFVFYLSPEGDIRLSLGVWDEDENGWHKRTYVETFWGLQLEREEFLQSPTND